MPGFLQGMLNGHDYQRVNGILSESGVQVQHMLPVVFIAQTAF